MNIIHRITHTKDLIFKLIFVICMAIGTAVVLNAYSDYMAEVQKMQEMQNTQQSEDNNPL